MITFEASTATESASLLTQMDLFWQNCPYTAAAVVCGIKASAADWIAQHQSQSQSEDATVAATTLTTEEEEISSSRSSDCNLLAKDKATTTFTVFFSQDKNNNGNLLHWLEDEVQSVVPSWMNARRNFAFLLYGSLYQGMVHEYVFNHLYPVWFGTGCDIHVVVSKVVFNLFIQTTLVTLPVAYLLKAMIMPTNKNADNHPIMSAYNKYIHDIQHQALLQKAFAIWGPVQCLTFSVIPEHYRVTFIALVSFFWLILLSHISNNEVECEQDAVEGEAATTVSIVHAHERIHTTPTTCSPTYQKDITARLLRPC